MTTTKKRLSSKTTPTFFKKLRNVAGIVGSVLGGIGFFAKKLPFVPPVVGIACDIASPLLLLLAGVSHATVPEDVKVLKLLWPKIKTLLKSKIFK